MKITSPKIFNCLTMSLPGNEGFGSLFCNILALYATSRRMGCHYLHTPLINVRCSTKFTNCCNVDSDDQFNQFILEHLLPPNHVVSVKGKVCHAKHQENGDFRCPEKENGYYELIHKIPSNCINLIEENNIEYFDAPGIINEIVQKINLKTEKSKVLRIDSSQYNETRYTETSLISEIREELIENYNATTKNLTTHFNKDEINVAIHVRRYLSPPDYPACHTQNREYFAKDGHMDRFYCLFIKNLSEKLKEVLTCFHIYAHAPDDFEDINQEYRHFANYLCSEKHRLSFHINDDTINTFHHLVKSDIFMMAKSALSFSAHFYSEGVNFIRSNPPIPILSHGNTITNEGIFEEKTLKQTEKLRRLLK